jgi:hypothetical protein
MFDFFKFSLVSGELFSGGMSHGRDFSHQGVEIDLSLDLIFDVIFEELLEIDLEFLKESDALGKSFTVEGGSDFNKGSDWVGSAEFGKFHEGFSGSVWGDSLKFWNDNLKGVKDELGLFLSGEEIDAILLSLLSGSSLFSVEHFQGGLTNLNCLLEFSSSLSESFDSLGSFLDLSGSMRDSVVEVLDLFSALSSLDGVNIANLIRDMMADLRRQQNEADTAHSIKTAECTEQI